MQTNQTHRELHGDVMKDQVDVYVLLVNLLRRWRIVALVTAVISGTVGVLNFFVISPIYESSAVVAFHNDDPALGIDLYSFRSFASSPSVMAEVARRAGLDLPANPANGLPERFEFESQVQGPLIVVKAKATDPHLAAKLVDAWITAIQSEVFRTMEKRLSERRDTAIANYVAAIEALTALENTLATFDQEFPIALMEARLQRDSEKLVVHEEQLENLRKSTIPVNEAAVKALKEVLVHENATFDSVFLLQSATADDVLLTQLNPTYLELRRRLAQLESALAADRVLAERLEEELPELEARIANANAELLETRLQRERLVRRLSEARALVEATRQERDEVLALERQLVNRARVEVISEPFVPGRPIAPRKMLSLAVSIVLGILVGSFGVLIGELWKSTSGVARARVM